MPFGVAHLPETVAAVQSMVETTTLTYEEISAARGVPVNTISSWTRRYKWRRPDGAGGRLALSPEQVAAARRVFENCETVADIAVLLDCSESRVYQMAQDGKWMARRSGAGHELPSPSADELAHIAAALRDPAATRGDVVRLIERAAALAVADAITTGEPRCEQRAIALGKYAAIVKNLPERRLVLAPGDALDGPAHFPDANELIEEIARRIEASANELLDPRILAILAETVP